jgi:hypothetical protein
MTTVGSISVGRFEQNLAVKRIFPPPQPNSQLLQVQQVAMCPVGVGFEVGRWRLRVPQARAASALPVPEAPAAAGPVGQYLPRFHVLRSSEAAKGVAIARRRWRGVDIELPVDGHDVLDVVDARITIPKQTSGIW